MTTAHIRRPSLVDDMDLGAIVCELVTECRLGGVPVLVASLKDIIASKEWANRPKDRAALDELRRLAEDELP